MLEGLGVKISLGFKNQVVLECEGFVGRFSVESEMLIG